nr:non-ribosomal peptide synthetase [Lysobacter enzymogenes]
MRSSLGADREHRRACIDATTAATGEQRLLPIQWRFLQADRAEHGRYVQYADVALADGIGRAQLQAALLALVARHDALRLKFRECAGGWMAQYRAEALSAEAWDDAIVEIDGDAAQAPATAREHIHAQVDAAMAELDVKQGRLLRWLWLRDANGSRLLWVMHHLVVDVVSWQVLAEDLATALDQLGRGEAVRLARKGATGCQDWAARLHDYAYRGELDAEKRYWLEQLRAPAAALAFDGDDEAPAQSSSRQHELRLPPALTRRLLDQATSRHGLRIHELLTAALGRALGQWQSVDAIRIDLESHGRPDLSDVPGFDGVDLSQTVGWFTALYPLRLERLRDDLRGQLRAAGAALAAVPHAGIGFGVLNELARDEDLEQAREGRESQVLFNYLGAFDPDRGGSRIGARRRRSHALNVEGGVEHGALTLRIDYSERQFQAASVAALAAQLERALVEIADDEGGPGAGVGVGTEDDGTSESTWSLADCTPAELQDLRRHYPALQDLYPCTGMQQGLLLMSDGANPDGVYLTQLRLTLDGADPQRLRAAWVELVRRHPVLRTAFLDRGGERLLQAVMREVALPWREIDVSALAEDRRDAELERALDDERRRAFALGEAPPMRVLLARLDARRHCLAWTHHHALIDGWSMGLLAQELFQVYAGQNEDAAPPPYRDYIAWLESRDHQAAADYWQRYLDGLPLAASAALSARLDDEADTDATGPSEQRAHVLELPVALTAQLDRALKHEGVSLGTAILAAWGLLQSKYSAEEEVLFGYTTSGRPPELDGIERMVGLFINSLPLRLRIDPAQTLSAWLRQVQSMQLDHGDHGFLPLAAIQRACGARAGQALFNALVVVENFPLDRSLPSMDGEQLRVLDARGVERSDFPLNLIVYPGPRLTVKLAYQSRQFGDAAARAMLDRLGHLLAGFAHGLDQRVGQLSPLSADERERAVREWNRSEVDYPLHACAHELFQQQAEALGDGDAIVCGDQRWSWKRLSARVAEVAAWLRRGGVRPGDRIALALPKEPELIAAILAIMRAGAAYVPVALDCPPERLAFIAGDAGIGRLLTVRAHAALADGSGLSALCLDEIDAAATNSNADAEALQDAEPQSSESTAYLIYTSGTTGTPKGVALSHRNLVNFSLWLGGAGLYGRGQGFTQFAPHTFDASIGEIFGALLAGATLHLLSDALIQEPRALAAYLGEHAIAFAAFPPPYLQQIDPAQVPANLSILTAGSAPTVELARAWSARCRYVNAYGPTETTVLSSAWMPAADDAELAAGRLSIGRPISNTTMYVVDAAGQLCAPGLLGEIWIGGAGVAQGYVNRPELTSQQFLDDPWRAGERVYRTGDHGRWLDDGRIEFIGRRDRQIKLRGFRIELGEIENRLREHAGVRDAAVLAHGDGAERRLLAWVVRHEDARAQPQAEFLAELRERLRRALPEYMLPQATMELAQLPLTGNGKLDVKALPAHELAAGAVGTVHIAPRDAFERALAEVWAAVLKLPSAFISADANFFDLGGQSLLAMQLARRISAELGCQMRTGDVFAAPTLAKQAERIRYGDDGRERFVSLQPDGSLDDDFPAAPEWLTAPPTDATDAAILLTGATGFIGRFLLRQLLDSMSSTVFCLVRGADAAEATLRLRTTMQRWRLWKPEDEARIVVCAGDLASPSLGLSARDRARIGAEVGMVFHNGTSMNHLEHYASAKPANVDGVRELLRLAMQGRPKTFHHVSTLGVFSRATPRPENARIDEHTSIESERHPHAEGYAASKWVAERLVTLAGERGLPCTIFRLGLVAGDREQGRYDERQGLHRLMHSASIMKAGYVDDGAGVALLPVDYVAQAIVALARAHRHAGGIFHLASTRPVPIERLFQAYATAFGEPIELLAHAQWLRRIAEFHAAGVCLPILPLVQEAIDEAARPKNTAAAPLRDSGVQFDFAVTEAALTELDLAAPTLDDATLAMYWRGLRRWA